MDNTDKDVAGVAAITLAFAKLGWTLRERGRIDYGIDADVEIKKNGEYQNKHIALQIKSGESYLKIKKDGFISFIVNDWHYKYWLKSDRPVLIMFYDIDNNSIIWEQVSLSKLNKTKKSNHLIEISPLKLLTPDSKVELEDILSTYRPFEVFKVDPNCVNFEYSIHCYREIKPVLNDINDDFVIFKKKVNEQIRSLNTPIFLKLFEDFTKRLGLNQDLLYENYCKSHWYISELSVNLFQNEQQGLNDIIESNKTILKNHITLWDSNAKDYSKLFNPNIPPEFQRAVKRLLFRINEYISMLTIVIDTQNSIQGKLNNRLRYEI